MAGASRAARLFACVALIAVSACSGDGDDRSSDQSSATAPVVTVGGGEGMTGSPDDDEPALPPEGTLRYAVAGGVTSFNPAAVNSGQADYLYPVYDTLTRQADDLSLVPGLATSWNRVDPETWEFTVRTDVVFHDGTPFDARAAVDNIEYHASFAGNPQSTVWLEFVEARVVDDDTFQVEFSVPVPQFPLQMSTAPGMMINPNVLDGTDLTRNPQGSGPWIWSESDSQAGVREVYDVNPDYWRPADQGVERIVYTSIIDNIARMNALVTGEADVATLTPEAQVKTGLDAGMELVSVPDFFPFILVADREGQIVPELADPRVRQAIGFAIDRDAYNDIVHSGRGNPSSGIYPENYPQFHVPELDSYYTYDPDHARELLADAGYPNGFTLEMPVMPVIQPVVELLAQMLGAVGIDVDLVQLNNGELGPRLHAGDVAITWLRTLQIHPAADLPHFVQGPDNPFELDDVSDVTELVDKATRSDDPDEAVELYGDAMRVLLESGTIIPLGHGSSNAMYSRSTTGVKMGIGIQSPPPHGVRVTQ